ncbi:MAG: hypothetical protein ACFFD4_01915 [Candidatus Odinarchaeota archaeon]
MECIERGRFRTKNGKYVHFVQNKRVEDTTNKWEPREWYYGRIEISDGEPVLTKSNRKKKPLPGFIVEVANSLTAAHLRTLLEEKTLPLSEVIRTETIKNRSTSTIPIPGKDEIGFESKLLGVLYTGSSYDEVGINDVKKRVSKDHSISELLKTIEQEFFGDMNAVNSSVNL